MQPTTHPLHVCPDCTRPRHSDDPACVCGYRWPVTTAVPLDPWTCATGLRGVAEARRTLRLARRGRQLRTAYEASIAA